MMVLAWLAIALAGLLIGATSIGGVLVVPALTAGLGIGLPQAIAASSFAFLITGLVAVLHWRRPHLRLRQAPLPLMLSALLGAALGAAFAHLLPAAWLATWIAVLAGVSGLQALRHSLLPPSVLQAATAPALAPAAWAVLGLLVGVGSALSGTGGPVMLLPVLMLLRQPLAASVLAAQAVQVPIALAASATHLLAQRLDGVLGAAVAGVLLLGALLGRRLALRMPHRAMLATTAGVLLLTGLWFQFK